MNYKHIVAYCSGPAAAVASAIITASVRERLAASVNRTAALRSTYLWQGKVCDRAPVLRTIKTQASRHQALEARIRALHPDALPEIIATRIVAGPTDCLDRVTRECAGTADGAPDSDGARSA